MSRDANTAHTYAGKQLPVPGFYLQNLKCVLLYAEECTVYKSSIFALKRKVTKKNKGSKVCDVNSAFS